MDSVAGCPLPSTADTKTSPLSVQSDMQQQQPSPQSQEPQHHHVYSPHQGNSSSHHGHEREAEMRESDGDILEAGIAPQPSTPVISAILPPSAIFRDGHRPSSSPERLPLLPEAAIVVGGAGAGAGPLHAGASCLSDVSSSSALGDSSGSFGATGRNRHAHQPQAGGGGAAEFLPVPPPPRYRRCLSGDDTPILTVGSASSLVSAAEPSRSSSAAIVAEEAALTPKSVADGAPEDRIIAPSSAAPAGAPDDIGEEAAASAAAGPAHLPTARSFRENPAVAMQMRPHRSKSIDRRLNEAAQFAEAVGEAPPTNESELKFIIEEDGSTDDSDDDEGIGKDRDRSVTALNAIAEMEAEFLAREHQDREERAAGVREEAVMEEMVGDTCNNIIQESPVIERQGPKSPFATDVQTSFVSDEGETTMSTSSSIILDAPPIEHSEATFISKSLAITQPPLSEGSARDEQREKQQQDNATASIAGQQQGIRRPRHFLLTKPAPSSTSGAGSSHHLTLLRSNSSGPNGVRNHPSSQPYVYKGIHSNPPEITKRGISRGNYAQLHRKAWLEVSDKYHRYGKNLRLYYKHWESLGHPTNMFFDWLDSKGEAAGQPLPNLPECPRSELDSDTVLYVTNPEVQERYLISIVRAADEEGGGPEGEVETEGRGGDAIFVDADGVPVRTGPDGWIFVLRDHVLYGGQKVTSIAGKSKQRFHHSSFFGGKAVAAAGILITDDSGRLTRLYPHSGHYRPTEAHMQRMLYFLQQGGFDLTTFDVDTQQILHVSRTLRDTPKGGVVPDEQVPQPLVENGAGNGIETVQAEAGSASACAAPKKCKKVQSLHLKPALYVACLLAHKARMIGEGVFSQIHKIRTEGATSVTEALDTVDEGGYWKKVAQERDEARENEC